MDAISITVISSAASLMVAMIVAQNRRSDERYDALLNQLISVREDVAKIQVDVAELKEGYREIKELHLAVVSMQKDFVKLKEEYKEIKVVVADTNTRVSRIEGAVLISPKLRNLFEDDLPSSPPPMQGTAVPASPVSTRVP